MTPLEIALKELSERAERADKKKSEPQRRLRELQSEANRLESLLIAAKIEMKNQLDLVKDFEVERQAFEMLKEILDPKD